MAIAGVLYNMQVGLLAIVCVLLVNVITFTYNKTLP